MLSGRIKRDSKRNLPRRPKTILNANDLNKISEVGSPLPVNYHMH